MVITKSLRRGLIISRFDHWVRADSFRFTSVHRQSLKSRERHVFQSRGLKYCGGF